MLSIVSQMAEQETNGQPAGDDLYRIRHSLAHVLAMAVQELRPGAKLGFGPPIDDGFYYDFVLSRPLSERDFPEIENRMRRILKRNLRFEEEDLALDEAYRRLMRWANRIGASTRNSLNHSTLTT